MLTMPPELRDFFRVLLFGRQVTDRDIGALARKGDRGCTSNDGVGAGQQSLSSGLLRGGRCLDLAGTGVRLFLIKVFACGPLLAGVRKRKYRKVEAVSLVQ